MSFLFKILSILCHIYVFKFIKDIIRYFKQNLKLKLQNLLEVEVQLDEVKKFGSAIKKLFCCSLRKGERNLGSTFLRN